MEELDKLYNSLKSEGYVTKSFEDWREKYENENGYQRKVFEVISRDGLYTKSFDDFQSKYSVKKKEQPDSSSSQEPTPSSEATTTSESVGTPVEENKNNLFADVAEAQAEEGYIEPVIEELKPTDSGGKIPIPNILEKVEVPESIHAGIFGMDNEEEVVALKKSLEQESKGIETSLKDMNKAFSEKFAEYGIDDLDSMTPERMGEAIQWRPELAEVIKDYKKNYSAAVDAYKESVQGQRIAGMQEAAIRAEKGNFLGATWNSMLEGIGSKAAGESGLLIDLMVSVMPEKMLGGMTPDEARKKVKADLLPSIRKGAKEMVGDKGTTDEYLAADKGFLNSAWMGLIRSLPAMATPKMSGMFFQISDDIQKEMDSDPEMKGLNEWEKQAVKIPIGLTGMLLERVGFRNLAKNKSIVKSIVSSALKKTPKDASREVLEKIISTEVKSFTQKLGSAAGMVATGAMAEFETGFMQEGSDIGIKAIYNGLKGKDLFQTPETLGATFDKMVHSGALEAVGGFMMSTPVGLTKSFGNSGSMMSDLDYELVEGSLLDDGIYNQMIEDIDSRVDLGEITAQEGDKQKYAAEKSREAIQKMPEGMPSERRKRDFDLLVQKGELELDLEGKDEALKKVSPEQKKIDEINEKLSGETETKETPVKEDTGELTAGLSVKQKEAYEKLSKEERESVDEIISDELYERSIGAVDIEKPSNLTPEESAVWDSEASIEKESIGFNEMLNNALGMSVEKQKEDGEVFTFGRDSYNIDKAVDISQNEDVETTEIGVETLPKMSYPFVQKTEEGVNNADISKPVIIARTKDGLLLIDGHHRVEKAIREGKPVKATILSEAQTKKITSQQEGQVKPDVATTEVKDVVTPEILEQGKKEVTDVTKGTFSTANPVKIFKGIGGKKDLQGFRINAHKGAKGVFSSVDSELAATYGRDEGVAEVVIPKGTSIEVVEVDGTGMGMSDYRAAEVKAINNSDAQIVKLITIDGVMKAGEKRQQQYVIKDDSLIEGLKKEESPTSTKDKVSTQEKAETRDDSEPNSIKVGDEVWATVSLYEDGKKVNRRRKGVVKSVNPDGSFDLQKPKGGLVWKNVKPEKIVQVGASKQTVEKETEGLSYKETVKQGVSELVDGIKAKARDKYDKAVGGLRDIVTKKVKDIKDFKERKSVMYGFAKSMLTDLKKSGVKYVPTRKINTIIGLIERSKTEASLAKNAGKLIDLVQNIAITDKEVKEKSAEKKNKAQAKKNAKTKLGHIRDDVNTILSLDNIPQSIQGEYRAVLENIGQRARVISVDAKAVSELAEKIRKEMSAEVTEDVDVESTEKEAATDEQVEEAVDSLRDLKTVLWGGNTVDFGSRQKMRSAREFAKLTWDYLKGLTPAELKNIAKEAANLENGFMTNGFIEYHKIKAEAKVKAERLHKSKGLIGVSNKFKNVVKKVEKVYKEAKDRQLNHIDQYFGSIKNTEIYDNLIGPISRAFARRDAEVKRVKRGLDSLLSKAIKSRVGRVKISIGAAQKAQRRLNILTDLYLLQKQHELNDGSPDAPPIKDIYDKINEDYDGENKAGYDTQGKEILDELYQKYKDKDGNINSEAILKDMTSAEKAVVEYIESEYENTFDKFIYLTEQLRGESIPSIAGYAFRNSIDNTSSEITSDEKLQDLKGGKSKYVRAGSTKARTSKAPLVRLGGITNFMRHINDVNLDYELSPVVRSTSSTLTQLKEMSDGDQAKFVAALERVIDGSIKGEYESEKTNQSTSRKIVDEVIRGVYSNLLINFVRVGADFLGNMSAYAVETKNLVQRFKNKDFNKAVKGIDKAAMDFIFKEFGSVHEDRIGVYSSDMKSTESDALSAGYSKELDTSEKILDFIKNNKVKELGKFANKYYYKFTDIMLESAWRTELVREYEKITGGEMLDVQRAMKDENYLSDIRANLDRAVSRADKHVSDMFNTSVTFERKTKAKSKNILDVINNFMQSFSYNENSVIWSGLKSAVGKGSMTKSEGIVKASSAVARMLMYTASMQMSYALVASMFGDGDDDDLLDTLQDSLMKGGADVFMIMAFGQFGGIIKGTIGNALNIIQDMYETNSGESIMKKEGDLFFGSKMDTSRDVFRSMGGLGYVMAQSLVVGKKINALTQAYAKGEDVTKELEDAKAHMAAFKILAAAFGIPFVRDFDKIIRASSNKKKTNKETKKYFEKP